MRSEGCGAGSQPGPGRLSLYSTDARDEEVPPPVRLLRQADPWRSLLVTGGTGTLGRLVTDRLRARRARGPGAEPPFAAVRGRSARRYGPGRGGRGCGRDRALRDHTARRRRAGGRTSDRGRAAGRACRIWSTSRSSAWTGCRSATTGRKLAVERMIEESGLGWTVLRTTQFHDLVLQLLAASAKLPVHAAAGRGERASRSTRPRSPDRLAELAVGRARGPGRRTWAAPRSGRCRSWLAPICGRRAAGGRSCSPYAGRARRTGRAGTGGI